MSELIHIFALPRSGTAFVSTMLNLNPRCIAFHELYEKTMSPRQSINTMLKVYDYVIDCNTVGWLLKNQVYSKKNICILRDRDSSLQATEAKLGLAIPSDSFYNCAEKLHGWVEKVGAFNVNYEGLFSLNVLSEIWNYCFDGTMIFPFYKVAELLHLNIQMQSFDRVLRPELQKKLREDMI